MSHRPSDTTDHPPELDFQKVVESVLEENTDPRTVAILGAAYLELYLKELIAANLRGLTTTLEEKIFGTPQNRGILSDLAAKIDMATALSLISSAYRNDCILVAHIRNRFAHQLRIDSFDHPEVTKLVNKLSYHSKMLAREGAMSALAFQGDARQKFVGSLIVLMTPLGNAIHAIRTAADAEPPPSLAK